MKCILLYETSAFLSKIIKEEIHREVHGKHHTRKKNIFFFFFLRLHKHIIHPVLFDAERNQKLEFREYGRVVNSF